MAECDGNGYTAVLQYPLPTQGDVEEGIGGGQRGQGRENLLPPKRASLPGRPVMNGQCDTHLPVIVPTRTIVGAQGRSVKATRAGAMLCFLLEGGRYLFFPCTIIVVPAPPPLLLAIPFICLPHQARGSFLTDSLDDSRTPNQSILGRNFTQWWKIHGSSHFWLTRALNLQPWFSVTPVCRSLNKLHSPPTPPTPQESPPMRNVAPFSLDRVDSLPLPLREGGLILHSIRYRTVNCRQSPVGRPVVRTTEPCSIVTEPPCLAQPPSINCLRSRRVRVSGG